MSKNEKILKAIQTALSNGSCEWSDIVKSVNDAKITIKNWMTVRGVLQWMIDNNMITRVNNVHKEQYVIA
jgi:hypothetical protein